MLTIQNCMLNRVGLRLLSGERNEPPLPEYFDAQWGFMRSLPCPQGYMDMVTNFQFDSKTIGVGAVDGCACGARAAQNCSCHFWCNLRFSGTFFSRTFPKHDKFTTDLRVRSSSTANTRTHESVRSRVGQIVTARATRSAARRNLRHSPRTFARRTRVRAALTSCGQRARASPVSRRYLAVSHRYLTGISSFLSPSGSRCTAAGARSHSPCGP